jgi:hypothetical protein
MLSFRTESAEWNLSFLEGFCRVSTPVRRFACGVRDGESLTVCPENVRDSGGHGFSRDKTRFRIDAAWHTHSFVLNGAWCSQSAERGLAHVFLRKSV